MVYESDFYTTRRPYSRPSPTITSYSVTTDIDPTINKAQPFQRNLPFVAHKRLTAPQAPPPRSKVRNSVLMAEIDRINHRYHLANRLSYLHDPSAVVDKPLDETPPQPSDPIPYAVRRIRNRFREGEVPLFAMARYDIFRLEMFFHDLNFDDETRSIRAQTAALLKRVHSPIPRSRGPLHVVLPTPSSLMETSLPNRHTSDHYIEGLLAPISKVQRDVVSRSFYVEHPRPYIGKGHLACVSFAGGRAYAKRRNHYDVPDDHHNVQDDIATLSYYSRARAVANGLEPGPEPPASTSRKSRPYKSSSESAPAPPVRAAPVRQPSLKEEPVREEPIAEEPAAEEAEQDAPTLTNGISAEEAEAARLAEEEAELERQLEAELRAEMEAKEAKKAKKAAAKKAAEEAEAQRLAAEAAAQKAAEEEDAAMKAAEENAAAEKAAAEEAARKAAEEEEARRQAEEEAEIERQVAAELEAERLAAEAKKAQEEEEQVQQEADPSEEPEVSSGQDPEEEETTPAAEPDQDEPEPEPESIPEPEPLPEKLDDSDAVEPEPEPVAESEDPVVDEPASPTVRDDADPFEDNGSKAEEIKSDEESGWPLDEE